MFHITFKLLSGAKTRALHEDGVTPEDSLYTFPSPPAPDLCEWAGSPLGISNTITRAKSRTAHHNKTVDATPGLLEKI